ncbi:MAG: histidine phosphatase family protein [Pseudomonadota bacterium]
MNRRSFLAALAALPVAAHADEGEVVRLLAEPHTHAIMRHALAPGTSDPAGFTIGDCTTQRNLDDRGRAQARATGAALRRGGARFDRVLTSQWCRCRDTAALLDLGALEDAPPLNSFFEDRHLRDPQTKALRALLDRAPADQTLMLVTHQVNITALLSTGVSSGEVFVFSAPPGRAPEIRGSLLIPA